MMMALLGFGSSIPNMTDCYNEQPKDGNGGLPIKAEPVADNIRGMHTRE